MQTLRTLITLKMITHCSMLFTQREKCKSKDKKVCTHISCIFHSRARFNAHWKPYRHWRFTFFTNQLPIHRIFTSSIVALFARRLKCLLHAEDHNEHFLPEKYNSELHVLRLINPFVHLVSKWTKPNAFHATALSSHSAWINHTQLYVNLFRYDMLCPMLADSRSYSRYKPREFIAQPSAPVVCILD